MLGDSLVHWAGERMATRNQSHLGIDGISVGWFGVRGMRWDSFISKVQYLTLSNKIPRVIFVHLGGNDFDSADNFGVQNRIKKGLRYLRSLSAAVEIVWIDIVQRRTWRGGNPGAMERKRARINRFAHNLILGLSGHVLKLDIDWKTAGFYRADGIHLSPVGIEMYVDGIRDMIKSLLIK